jgi:hypothetical protein
MRLRGSATAVLVAVAATTSACTSAPSISESATAPTASLTASTAVQTYTSARLGYRIQLPPDWTVAAGYLDWEFGVEPTHSSPSFDTLADPAGRPFILIGRQQRPSGEALGAWLGRLQSTKTITYPDRCMPATPELDTSLGAEPAKSFSLHCPSDGPDAVGLQVLAMHGHFGYLLMCYDENWGATRTDELVNQCRAWSKSFTYLPA